MAVVQLNDATHISEDELAGKMMSDHVVNEDAVAFTVDDLCRRTAVLAGLRVDRVDEDGFIYLGDDVSTRKEGTVTPDKSRAIAAELAESA